MRTVIGLDIFSFIFFRCTYLFIIYTCQWAFLAAQMVKNLPAMQKTQVQSLGCKDPLGKEMATHSSILAWRISWTQEPLRLLCNYFATVGLQRVRHDWASNTLTFNCFISLSFLFFFLVALQGMRDLSFPPRDRIHAASSGSVESWPLDCQGNLFLLPLFILYISVDRVQIYYNLCEIIKFQI